MTDPWTRAGFTQTPDNLFRYGPTVNIGIGSPDDDSSQFSVLAQIDTGAAGCGISPRLAARLDFKPVGAGAIHEAGREPISADIFRVRLFLPFMDIVLDVAGLPSLAEPHEILIGRDALTRFRVAVDFTSGVTQLHFRNDQSS